jgi:diguanylate cyclase (GGDEF)-like protein
MEQTLLKALVVLEEGEDSWFMNGDCQQGSNDHLMDVRVLRVKVQAFHATLRMIEERAPDVLLLDSTLSKHFVMMMAIQVRHKMPQLPILLLPNFHGALKQSESAPGIADYQFGSGAETGSDLAIETIARTLLYTHGRLGLQRTLLQMALRDDLTGLHNRRGFMALATQQLKWARDTGQHMLMFFADLDGLKWINDHFGHGEGDRAISLTGRCIKETFRKFDVTGRLSGDEFVALIQEEPGRSAEAICQRLGMNLANCAGAESRYKLSLSVGVAHFDPGKPATLQELMRQADTAMYQHKRRDGSSVSDGLAAANAEASARVAGAARRPALGESTAAAANSRWLSVAQLELSASGNSAL